ncbi:cytoskeleton-associated protein 2 [Sphaeramia orbicularis]|uniref:Cytoskeleton-associated protein 2-like n=1 Tax=Sphaeramia orbicularis TaxID=375764 RepID=A0A672YLV6_9TELE|nr:cytoskeleton-associated protein 2-like [Sphaeramia orbicularis]
MDTVAASRRNHTSKKGNKENAQPANETKSLIRRGISKPPLKAPLQPKGKEKDQTTTKSGLLKASTRQTDGKLTSTVAVKNITLKKVEKVAPAPQSHAFTSTQASKHKKLAAEAPKPPTAAPSSKPAPGMYKGRIIQSKIGSIWKSSSSLNSEDAKPSAPKTTNQRVGNLTKSRITPAAGCSTQKPVPPRSKTVSDGATKPASRPVASRPPTGFSSARPPTRTVPTAIRSRNATAGPTKRCGTLISKPTIPATDRKASKPPVCSTLSQYRRAAETEEQKKAKLAEWLASKGKNLKRPAMVTRPPTKTKAPARPEDHLKPQPEPQPEPEPAAQCNPEPEPEPSLDTHEPSSTSADERVENQEPDVTQKNPTPEIMNTTLDLLENSDVDLSINPAEGVDDIVINLCEALEAMETPSCCNDEPPQVTDECNDVEVVDELKDENKQEEVMDEKPEDVVEKTEEEADEQELEDSLEEVDSDDDVMESTSAVRDASVVKYSVKTTPYLQSVKKTIADEVGTGSSRRKSNISDVKFLTPVRRSSRIQRKSSRLPTMLVDHDPCVSSLAELVKLDDNPNAYIYRKNPALLEDLPDEPRV